MSEIQLNSDSAFLYRTPSATIEFYEVHMKIILRPEHEQLIAEAFSPALINIQTKSSNGLWKCSAWMKNSFTLKRI